MEKTVAQKHKKNFETLKKAFRSSESVALMDCIEKATGEHVAVICIVTAMENGDVVFVPSAKFFNGNPYDLLINPNDPEYNKKEDNMKIYQIVSDYGYGNKTVHGTFLKRENAIAEYKKMNPSHSEDEDMMFCDEKIQYIDVIYTQD